jgi:hypothetical protein
MTESIDCCFVVVPSDSDSLEVSEKDVFVNRVLDSSQSSAKVQMVLSILQKLLKVYAANHGLIVKQAFIMNQPEYVSDIPSDTKKVAIKNYHEPVIDFSTSVFPGLYYAPELAIVFALDFVRRHHELSGFASQQIIIIIQEGRLGAASSARMNFLLKELADTASDKGSGLVGVAVVHGGELDDIRLNELDIYSLNLNDDNTVKCWLQKILRPKRVGERNE